MAAGVPQKAHADCDRVAWDEPTIRLITAMNVQAT
jgi:hypothetical protein